MAHPTGRQELFGVKGLGDGVKVLTCHAVPWDSRASHGSNFYTTTQKERQSSPFCRFR
jgi:hypothetical protein